MLSFFPLTSDLVEFVACFSKLTFSGALLNSRGILSSLGTVAILGGLAHIPFPGLSSQILYLLSALPVQGEHQCKAGD